MVIINLFLTRKQNFIFILMFLFSFILACEQQPTEKVSQYINAPINEDVGIYRFAMHFLHNIQTSFEAYQPLVDCINNNITDIYIEFDASRYYPSYEGNTRSRKADLLLPHSLQTLQAMENGYRAIAMAGDAEDFKGILIIRKNSNIHPPVVLKRQDVSYPAALAIMPQYFFHTHGINISKNIVNIYVDSQESSIMNAYLETVAVWATIVAIISKVHPEQAKQRKAIWQTPAFINNSVRYV
jgi:phosphonate transport system substrate-binding protein